MQSLFLVEAITVNVQKIWFLEIETCNVSLILTSIVNVSPMYTSQSTMTFFSISLCFSVNACFVSVQAGRQYKEIFPLEVESLLLFVFHLLFKEFPNSLMPLSLSDITFKYRSCFPLAALIYSPFSVICVFNPLRAAKYFNVPCLILSWCINAAVVSLLTGTSLMHHATPLWLNQYSSVAMILECSTCGLLTRAASLY